MCMVHKDDLNTTLKEKIGEHFKLDPKDFILKSNGETLEDEEMVPNTAMNANLEIHEIKTDQIT